MSGSGTTVRTVVPQGSSVTPFRVPHRFSMKWNSLSACSSSASTSAPPSHSGRARSSSGVRERVRVRDVAKIVVGGEEAPGLIAYGLLAPGVWGGDPFPSKLWAAQPEVKPYFLRGDDWRIVLWEFEVLIWPATLEFRAAVRATLRSSVRSKGSRNWRGPEEGPKLDRRHGLPDVRRIRGRPRPPCRRYRPPRVQACHLTSRTGLALRPTLGSCATTDAVLLPVWTGCSFGQSSSGYRRAACCSGGNAQES